MDVSKNRGGPPKSSILIGFPIINHPFWGTTIFGNTQIDNLKMSTEKPSLKTNSNFAPENRPKRHKRKRISTPTESIFRWEVMLVSGSLSSIFKQSFWKQKTVTSHPTWKAWTWNLSTNGKTQRKERKDELTEQKCGKSTCSSCWKYPPVN